MSLPRVALLATSAIMMLACASGLAVERQGADATGEIRFIYLVPSDRTVSPTNPDRIAFAARHFQSWLGQKLGGRTFQLSSPAVRTIRSDKPAKWFGSLERHTGFSAFYFNTLDELTRLGVAKLNDPQARYLVFVDADHPCGQSGAGGNGFAVVSANDLRGLNREPIVPACATANSAEIASQCRWIGGMGHELLHTLGLTHPDRSPACQTSQCRSDALMVHGYITYPKAILLEDEKTTLIQSRFMQARSSNPPIDCAGP